MFWNILQLNIIIKFRTTFIPAYWVRFLYIDTRFIPFRASNYLVWFLDNRFFSLSFNLSALFIHHRFIPLRFICSNLENILHINDFPADEAQSVRLQIGSDNRGRDESRPMTDWTKDGWTRSIDESHPWNSSARREPTLTMETKESRRKMLNHSFLYSIYTVLQQLARSLVWWCGWWLDAALMMLLKLLMALLSFT